MPGHQFNPDKNLFSVAPVGQIVIIGRSITLRGGLSREHALNLATWLLISANATPEEVKAGIQDAMTPNAVNLTGRRVVGLVPQRTVPQPPPPQAPKAQEVAPEVAGQVAPFIGEIDPEEAEGIEAATTPQTGPKAPPAAAAGPVLPKVRTVDPDALANAWGGPTNG